MNSVDPLMIFLLFIPLLVFYFLFKKNWVDIELKRAALAGFFVGVFCITLTRLVYFPIEWFLGTDLRGFISAPRAWWITLLASVAIIGLVEESIKAGGGLLASILVKFNRRPTVLFMTFISCALSFSFLENIQYYAIFGSSVVVPRLIVSSTAHVFFSALCAAVSATALTRPKSDSIISVRIFAGIGIAALLHGLFDFMVFEFNLQAVSGMIVTSLAVFFLGIYESWIAVLKIDTQNNEGLMICSGCGAFSIGRARFCNFCGSRVILSRRDFTIKIDN